MPPAEPVDQLVHAEAAPVFVDQSGTRGRRLRGLGWLVGLASTMLAAAMTGSLVGLQSQAPMIHVPPQPSSTIPVPSAHPSGPASPSATVSPSPGVGAKPSGSARPSGSAKASGTARPTTSHSPSAHGSTSPTHKTTTTVTTRPGTTARTVTRVDAVPPVDFDDDQGENSELAAPHG